MDNMDRLLKLQKRLIALTKWKLNCCGHGKSQEPAVTVTIDNDLQCSGEIYSYVMNFLDGGRHHVFHGDTLHEVLHTMECATDREEKELLQTLTGRKQARCPDCSINDRAYGRQYWSIENALSNDEGKCNACQSELEYRDVDIKQVARELRGE